MTNRLSFLKCQLCKRAPIMRLAGRWPRCKLHILTRVGRKHVHEKRNRNCTKPRATEYDAGHVGAGRTAIDQSAGALGRAKSGDVAVHPCERCGATGLTLDELRGHYRRHNGK